MPLSDDGQYPNSSPPEDELTLLRRQLAASQDELAVMTGRALEAEKQARNMFNGAPCVMLVTSTDDFTILDVNDAFVRESGYPRELVLGKRTSDFPWWPDAEVRDRLLSALRRHGEASNVEVRFLDKSGDDHVVMLNARSITVQGRPCLLTHTADVTERVRSEEARHLLEQAERDKQRLESLGLVAGGIAHDFNNLLVGILGNAELLLGAVPASSPYSVPLRSILRSAEHAADHARELLDYAGRGIGQGASVDLGKVVREVLELSRPHTPPGLTVERSGPSEGVWARADRGQLTRMLVNLVKNGLEAMAGRVGSVRVNLASDEHSVIVRVSDRGTGMDETTRARLFDPFFSTKQTGHGFGLASVHSIVQRHQGTISVDTQPGQGTTFTVRLPRAGRPEEHELSRVVTPEPPAHGHVLVVDDDQIVRETGRALLSELGYTVVEAHDGASAIAALRDATRRFDAVLLDATMPGLSMAETLAGLRALSPSLPVLLCSGYSCNDFAQELAQDRQLEFLAKPYRTSELVRMLAKLMARGAPGTGN